MTELMPTCKNPGSDHSLKLCNSKCVKRRGLPANQEHELTILWLYLPGEGKSSMESRRWWLKVVAYAALFEIDSVLLLHIWTSLEVHICRRRYQEAFFRCPLTTPRTSRVTLHQPAPIGCATKFFENATLIKNIWFYMGSKRNQQAQADRKEYLRWRPQWVADTNILSIFPHGYTPRCPAL